MSWPPRWNPGETHFKTKGSPKVRRAVKRIKRDAIEKNHKAAVRRRDGYCRFPLCGCGKFKLRLDVCHLDHKGMGGNPAGDCSTSEGMILLCHIRHRDSRVALDQGTLRVTPLTERGTAGPCEFAIQDARGAWLVLARETARHVYEPIDRTGQKYLLWLAQMDC